MTPPCHDSDMSLSRFVKSSSRNFPNRDAINCQEGPPTWQSMPTGTASPRLQKPQSGQQGLVKRGSQTVCGFSPNLECMKAPLDFNSHNSN